MAIQHQRLTIFAADDATPILGSVDGSGNVTVPTCTTDPAGVRPFMHRALDQSESAIDIIEGTSLVGQTNVSLLDKRITTSDQSSGWFTAILADPTTKQGQLMGHRILVEQQSTAGLWYTIIDGVIGDISLMPDLVSYELAIRDMRDRERKIRCFTKCSGLSIYPRGFINGYGKFAADAADIQWFLLSNPIGPAAATFRLDPNSTGKAGVASLSQNAEALDNDYIYELLDLTYMTQKFKSASTYATSNVRYNTGSLISLTYGNIKVHWRPRGSLGAFTILSDMPVIPGTLFSSASSAFVANQHNGGWAGRATWFSDYGVIMTSSSGAGLPANGQQIELKIEYAGPPTEKYPLYIEKTFGQLLKDVYDGVYSDEPTRIRYNPTTMANFVTKTGFARVKITAPEDDVRDWTEKAIYKPNFYAPSIDSKGRVSPISGALPDVGMSMFALDDTNIVEGSWVHSSQQIVNKIVVKYIREYLLTPGTYVPGITTAIGEREVEFTDIHPSVGLNGDHKVEYEPGTLRTMGYNGGPLNGNANDESGAKLMQARAHDMFDRLAYGVQQMEIKAQRHDVGVAGAQVGDWATVGSSYMPDYVTGKRGINRIAQVISIKETDPASRTFTLLDGGANAAPIAAPTIGALTAANGSVTIPITTTPAGGYVNVEYAVGAAQPGAASGAWLFAGRIDVAGSVITPLLPPGATVWARARGTGENKRSSVWVYTASINTVANPIVGDVSIALNDNSDPVISWTSVPGTAGVHIDYTVQAAPTVDTMPIAFTSFGDANATLGSATLTGITVKQFERLVIQITGYTAFAGGVASGTAGTPKIALATRYSQDTIWPTLREFPTEDGVTGTLVLTSNDPQYRLTTVEAAVTQADGTFGTYNVIAKSGGVYTITVPMRDKQPSRIQYRFTAITSFGGTFVVGEGTVRFAIGSRPAPPEVSYQISSDGTFTATSKGDSDTTLHQFVVKLDTAPTVAEVDAATGADNSFVGRVVSYTFKNPDGSIRKLTPGQKFYIGVRAYNSNMPGGSLGVKGSDLVSQTDQWFTPSTASATVTVGSVGIDSRSITLNGIVLSPLASYVDVYAKEYVADPGAPANISRIGYYIVGSPLFQNGSLVIPVAKPSDYMVITLLAVDSINRVGAGESGWTGTGTCPTVGTLNIKVQAAASAQPAPNPPTDLVLTTPTQDSVNLAVTIPTTNLPATLRIFRDGVALPDVTRTAVAGGVQNIVDTGRTPGATHTYVVYGVNAVGLLSTTGSPSRTITLPSITLPTPSITVGLYDRSGFSVTITPGAGSPGGETWVLEHQTHNYPGGVFGPWSTAETQTATTFNHAHSTNGVDREDKVRVYATKAGYGNSLTSNEVLVYIPPVVTL